MKYHLGWSNGFGYSGYQKNLLNNYPHWNSYLIQFLALNCRYVFVIYEDNTKISLIDREADLLPSQPLSEIKRP